MSRRREILAAVALVLAGVTLAFLIAEIAVRVTGLAKVSLYTWAPQRGWGLKAYAAGWQRDEGAGFVSVNRAGFRGPERTVAKPAGTFRIAVLGDSVTEAAQVNNDQTFCAVAESALGGCKALAGKRVQVMNFGVDSYGTAQELITLDRYVWQYSPDMVVLAFFPGNDVRNNSVVLEGDQCRPFYVYQGDTLTLGGPFERSRWFHFSCLMRFESRHSQILNLLGHARSAIRSRIRNWRSRRHERNASASHAAAMRQPGLDIAVYGPPVIDVWKDAWRVTEGIITAMARDAKAHRVPLLVVTLSTPVQDYPGAEVARFRRAQGSTDLFYPNDRIAALGAREGFAVLDLARPMHSYAVEYHAFLHGFANTELGTGHYNALGHRLAGELLAARICAMLSPGGSDSGRR